MESKSSLQLLRGLGTRGWKPLFHQPKPSSWLYEPLQQHFPHVNVFEKGRAGVSTWVNTVEANSELFKQMFMNIFCHACRVLIVIWIDGHMNLKVEDWIYGRKHDLGDERPSCALESEGSHPALHKYGQVTWVYCSVLPMGPRSAHILLGEHICILSRPVSVLDCIFIHDCAFLTFCSWQIYWRCAIFFSPTYHSSVPKTLLHSSLVFSASMGNCQNLSWWGQS